MGLSALDSKNPPEISRGFEEIPADSLLRRRALFPGIRGWVYGCARHDLKRSGKPIFSSFQPFLEMRHFLVVLNGLVVFIYLEKIEYVGIGIVLDDIEHHATGLPFLGADCVGPHFLEELLAELRLHVNLHDQRAKTFRLLFFRGADTRG